jgi:feruloyl esterase
VEGSKTTRTRPICAYPQVAAYKGSGSIDAAENFSCVSQQ